MKKYLSGEILYGDNFSIEEIENWFNEEKEGYANLASNEGGKKAKKNSDLDNYEYVYHEFNIKYAYSKLPSFNNKLKVVSFGGAYGIELLPILHLIGEIIIIEPSLNLRQQDLKGIPITYITPNISGEIELEDNSCDLITCFGVLHHIPNVSFVVSEFKRILKPKGFCLIREPIVSMGDWTKKRNGLTKNERGIPLQLFRDLANAYFKIHNEMVCTVTPIDSIFKKFTQPYNNKFYLFIDYYLSFFFRFNYRYHANSFIQKFRPVNVFYVLQKDI